MKRVFVLNQFHGGWNSEADPKDIAEYELSTAQDVMVSKRGKITMMGSDTTGSFSVSASTIRRYTNGYGLYGFASDYTITGGTTPTHYIGICGKDSTSNIKVAIFNSSGTAWGTTTTLLATTTMSCKPAFYYADGGLRVYGGDINNASATTATSYWIGYIKRIHFTSTDTGATDTYNGWYAKANTLAAPTRGLCTFNGSAYFWGQADAASTTAVLVSSTTDQFENMDDELDSGVYYVLENAVDEIDTISSRTDDETIATSNHSVAWDSRYFAVFPPAGTGFNVGIRYDNTFTAGTIPAGDYEFASSFIYDDSQESKLFDLIGPDISVTLGGRIRTTIYCTSPFDPRISGGRIYMRTADTDDDWTLITDINLTTGCRYKLTDNYTSWNWLYFVPGSVTAATAFLYTSGNTGIWINDIPTDTYKSLNGEIDQTKDITAIYSTGVVINRMAYIGNVKINGKRFSDSIFKSFVNRFDMFTEDRRLDVAINDGEEIVKLESFADRILEFKTKTLYIINVSQEVEYVESKHDFMGIAYPYQACPTEFGVAWINERGCFLYTGEKIVDLLLDLGNPSVRKIALSAWTTHLGTYPYVMYDSNNKFLLVGASYGLTPDEVYLYDFVTGSWTYGVDKITQAGAGLPANSYTRSNPIINYIGEVEWVYSTTITTGSVTLATLMKWTNTAEISSNFSVNFKDLDFGDPASRKSIYAIFVTYKATATAPKVMYATNGDAAFTKLYSLTVSTSWVTKKITSGTVSGLKNIYNLRLGLSVTTSTSSSFELNDISIIYREKSVR